MRLTGGRDRGHPLSSPRGADIRPTSDRVRQALFNILGSVEGLYAADLFAGAGTLGMEALSRGAVSVCFVEKNTRALKALRESLERLDYVRISQVVRRDLPAALTVLSRSELRFDLVFLDPPYGCPKLNATLESLAELELVSPSGRVVVEHDRDDLLADFYGGYERFDQRRYGRTRLSIYQNLGNR